jgi:hypothetical protein
MDLIESRTKISNAVITLNHPTDNPRVTNHTFGKVSVH